MLRWCTTGRNHFLYDGDRSVASVTYSIMDGFLVTFRGRSLGRGRTFEEGRSKIDAELKKEAEDLQRYLGGVNA